MAKKSEKSSAFVHHVRFVGRESSLVKTLNGFKKSHHTVPDAVNAATSGFLAKLCADELAADAENLFQQARTVFNYKRKEIALDVVSPHAVLSAKDFSFEISYSLDEANPATYIVTRSLSGLRSTDFAALPECDQVFAGQFSELAFVLTKGASVESVIDAVEAIDDSAGLTVHYPSDCSHCTLAVAGVSAEVRFESGELAMVFPRAGAPRELLESFMAVREAFSLSKQPVLAGLLQ
ncbi:MAG: hypothetical protein QM790_17075 [Nibricoccus sp.]